MPKPNGCYHTVLDDLEHIDGDKLVQQIDTATELVMELLTNPARPQFVGDAPATTFDDAVALLEIVELADPDLDLLAAEQTSAARQLIVDLQQIVDSGAEGYDDESSGTLLGGASALVSALSEAECTVPD